MHIHKKSLNLKASVRLVFKTICEQWKLMTSKWNTACLLSTTKLANSQSYVLQFCKKHETVSCMLSFTQKQTSLNSEDFLIHFKIFPVKQERIYQMLELHQPFSTNYLICPAVAIHCSYFCIYMGNIYASTNLFPSISVNLNWVLAQISSRGKHKLCTPSDEHGTALQKRNLDFKYDFLVLNKCKMQNTSQPNSSSSNSSLCWE